MKKILLIWFVLNVGLIAIFSFGLSASLVEKEIIKLNVASKKEVLIEYKKNKDIRFIKEREQKKGKELREERIEKSNGIVYLTFDDGPSKYTKGILKVLDEFDMMGTFFFIGGSLNLLSDDMVENIKRSNHSVGAHSMTHDKEKIYNQKLFLKENEKVISLLGEKGIQTNLVRAPYGSTYLSDKQIKEVKDQGWVLLDWNIDSLDWKFRNVNKTYKHIISQLNTLEKKNKRVINILLHEKPETTGILKKLIPELTKRGYLLFSGEEVPFKELIFKGR